MSLMRDYPARQERFDRSSLSFDPDIEYRFMFREDDSSNQAWCYCIA